MEGCETSAVAAPCGNYGTGSARLQLLLAMRLSCFRRAALTYELLAIAMGYEKRQEFSVYAKTFVCPLWKDLRKHIPTKKVPR